MARSLGEETEPLVRSHAVWALGRLGGRSARMALERRRKAESDSEVGAEIAAAAFCVLTAHFSVPASVVPTSASG